MENKVKAIMDAIQEAFPDAKIDYREQKFELYKFRIYREMLPCWIYFDWQYFLNHNEREIISQLRQSVFKKLVNNIVPKWLAVGDFGVKEVDENYSRGH